MKNDVKKAYCFIGMPLSGKSHAAKLIANKYGYTYISTGDIARRLSVTTDLKDTTAANDMFPLEDKLRSELCSAVEDSKTSVIIDGFPRSVDQVSYLVSTFWHLFPTVVSINAGDESILMHRARIRARDIQDVDEKKLLNRLSVARVNISCVMAELDQKLIRQFGLMSGDDKAMLAQFKKFNKTR